MLRSQTKHLIIKRFLKVIIYTFVITPSVKTQKSSKNCRDGRGFKIKIFGKYSLLLALNRQKLTFKLLPFIQFLFDFCILMLGVITKVYIITLRNRFMIRCLVWLLSTKTCYFQLFFIFVLQISMPPLPWRFCSFDLTLMLTLYHKTNSKKCIFRIGYHRHRHQIYVFKLRYIDILDFKKGHFGHFMALSWRAKLLIWNVYHTLLNSWWPTKQFKTTSVYSPQVVPISEIVGSGSWTNRIDL